MDAPAQIRRDLDPFVRSDLKVEIPVDRAQVGELARAFGELPMHKQQWLLTRFAGCETDVEATRKLDNADVSQDKVERWKKLGSEDPFVVCYRLLKGGLVDWEEFVMRKVEMGNALIGALEARKLIEKPWDGMSARESTEKGKAIQASIDRAIGRKERVDVKVRRAVDIIPEG